MVIALLLLQLALCAAILHREVVQLEFRNLASSIFFVVYAIVFILEPLVLHLFFGGARSIMRGENQFFSDPFVYYLFNCYGLALLSIQLMFSQASVAAERRSVSMVAPTPAESDGETTYVAVLIISGVLLFIYATGMSLGDLLIASRFAWFGDAGFSLFWLTVSSYFVALAGIYAYLVKVRDTRTWWVMALCLGAIILHGVITKDRKWVIFLASGWLAGHYDLSGRKLTVRKRVLFGIAALFFVLVISQFIRDVIFRYALGEQIDFIVEIGIWQSFLIEYGDISYFYRASLEAIHQNVQNGVLIPLAIVRRILFFFVPVGYSSGLKVEDISATFSDVVDGGDALRRGNMPPGLFGLFVISFGWFWSLFLIPTLALLLRKLDVMFRFGQGTFRQAVASLYVFAVVLAFRGDDSSAFYFIMSTFLFMGGWNMLRLLRRVRPLATSEVGAPDPAHAIGSGQDPTGTVRHE